MTKGTKNIKQIEKLLLVNGVDKPHWLQPRYKLETNKKNYTGPKIHH